MSLPLRAKVQGGHLVFEDLATELPEGMEIDVFTRPAFEQLTKEEQDDIDEACDEAEAQLAKGEGISAKDFAEQLLSMK